uniref:Uncharacterized protein n=1 Tax=Rhipicephalus appendiculatus TaxID=34631 RepID=A0A131YC46_RHIAP
MKSPIYITCLLEYQPLECLVPPKHRFCRVRQAKQPDVFFTKDCVPSCVNSLGFRTWLHSLETHQRNEAASFCLRTSGMFAIQSS